MACPVQCVQLKVLLNHVRRASREGECTARTHLAWDFSMGEPPIAYPSAPQIVISYGGMKFY